MIKSLNGLGRVAALLVVSGVFAQAQGTQTASMTAQVVDQAGKPLAGVRMILSSPSLQGQRVLTTDASGRGVARLLPPGQYRIVVAKDGFNAVTMNEHIGLEQLFSPHIKLSPMSAMATVEVVASAVGADKTESKIAFNYSKEDLDNLPVARTSQLDIAYLTPGVSKSQNSDRGEVEVRGSQGTGNLVLVDGQNTMDNTYVGQRIGIIMDALDETQVLVGAIPAEYGFVEGGVINSVSKVGGNDFSGSLRFDLTNPNWNAVAPMQGRDSVSIPNHVSQERSVTFGGPIIKDKLWFFVAGYDAHPQTPASVPTSQAGEPTDTSYIAGKNDYRREIKLTFSPTTNNTFTATYNNANLTGNVNYGYSGDLYSIVDHVESGNFWSLSWRSLITESMTLNARMGAKNQTFSSVPTAGEFSSPIWANGGAGPMYNQPLFDPTDPKPDDRQNTTANIKLSYFWNALGNHETDFGIDQYVGTTQASGYQSPVTTMVPSGVGIPAGAYNNGGYNVDSYNMVTQMSTLNPGAGGTTDGSVYLYQYVPDKATVTTVSGYINDKWTVDNHLNFNLGLRYDTYNAKNESVGKLASNGALAPRLGVKYDINGDGKWVVGTSYSVLQGRPLEIQFAHGGYVNNPITIYAPTTLSAGTYDLNTITNINNYNLNGASITDGTLNVRFDPHLKAQMVEEFQVNLAYNFDNPILGKGYVRGNFVHKNWENLVDVGVGPWGSVTAPAKDGGGTLDVNYWHNDPYAKKQYTDLDMDIAFTKGHFSFTGNITWSELWGNYVGEASGNPGLGQSIQTYNQVAGTTVYNPYQFNPVGRLVTIGSQPPLSMNATAQYSMENALGRTTFGVIWQFRSGAHFDNVRNMNLGQLYPAAQALDSNVGSKQVTQYEDNQRGTGIYNSYAYTDLAITQDFNIWKRAAGAPVVGYVKLFVHNMWNHQQDITWDTTMASSPAGGLAAPFTGAFSTYGQPIGLSSYGDARAYTVSVGVKF